MEFEIFQVEEDGTHVPVDLSKINDVLSSNNVIILIDHDKRRIYNFNGKESKIRTRFIGARLAAETLRYKLGMSYNVQAVEEGEETQAFRDLVREITCPGSTARRRAAEKTPAAPPVVKIFIDKEVAPGVRPSAPELPRIATSDKEPLPTVMKSVTELQPPSLGADPSYSTKAESAVDGEVTSVISKLGDAPDGFDVEAIIVNNAVYKYAQIQSKVLGKRMEQTKVERINEIDGLFTLDGEVRVMAKDGKVLGIQVLSKQKTAAIRKPRQGTE